jgi:hypothetical protein
MRFHLCKKYADDELFPVSVVFDLPVYHQLWDATYALSSAVGYEREIRLFAVTCAQMVAHPHFDSEVLHAIAVTERFVQGTATTEELHTTNITSKRVALATGHRVPTDFHFYGARIAVGVTDRTVDAFAVAGLARIISEYTHHDQKKLIIKMCETAC